MSSFDLAAKRAELGITQQRLADLSGVSEGTIRNIEAGRHDMRPSTLRRLETALNTYVSADKDPELAVLGHVVELLAAMDSAEQQRTLRYLNDRFNPAFDSGEITEVSR